MQRAWARVVPFWYGTLFMVYRSWWVLIPFIVLVANEWEPAYWEALRIVLIMTVGIILILRGVPGFTHGLQYERDGVPGTWVLHFAWVRSVIINGRPHRGFYFRRVVPHSTRGLGETFYRLHPDVEPIPRVEYRTA